MSVLEWLSLAVGALELALALTLLRELGRFGGAFPWLAALMMFFALRGVDRIYTAVVGDESQALAFLVDGVLILVLLLLLVGVDRTVRGLKLAQDEARYREEEYARALADYRVLARHRLANPITAIRGGVATLRQLPLGPDEREAMLDAIEREAERLEHIALDPRDVAPEERSLRPRPELRSNR